MKLPSTLIAVLIAGLAAGPVWSHTAPETKSARRAPAPARSSSTRVTVHEMSGTPLAGVDITILGGSGVKAVTDAAGTASVHLSREASRLRFERKGFIPLERELTIGAVPPAEISVALNAAPVPPAPPPAPAQTPAPPRPVATSGGRTGTPTSVSIPTFLDTNLIGREPYKESILGCTPDATARLVQVKDPLKDQTAIDADEVLYVVAGQGTLRMSDHAYPLEPGSVSVIPRGVTHGIERHGRTPLVMLSTMAGVPCAAGTQAQGNK